MLGLFGDQRDRLDARRSGADDPDSLAGKIDALVRPAVGAVNIAGEMLDARDIDILGLRQAAGRHDEKSPADGLAPVGDDVPAMAILVPDRLFHPRAEADVAAQIKAFGDMPGVAQDFRLGRIFLAPFPFLLEIGIEAERIVDALDIAARTRIAVPVPGATDIVTRLESAGGKPHLPKLVQQIETGKARPDHDHIQLRLAR